MEHASSTWTHRVKQVFRRANLLEKLEGEGWVKRVLGGEKCFVVLHPYIYYLYYMALFGGRKEDYKRWRKKGSRAKTYYSRKVKELKGEKYIVVLDKDFYSGRVRGRKKRVLERATSLLKNREVHSTLRALRNRIEVYRFLYSLVAVELLPLLFTIKTRIVSLLRKRKLTVWSEVVGGKGPPPHLFTLRVRAGVV